MMCVSNEIVSPLTIQQTRTELAEVFTNSPINYYPLLHHGQIIVRCSPELKVFLLRFWIKV